MKSLRIFQGFHRIPLACKLWPVGPRQSPKHASVMVPDTTVERAQDRGVRAHTNHLMRMDVKPDRPGGGGPSGETPSSIRGVYALSSSGGSGTIAIVDAYDYPTAENDLNVFSSQFGPACLHHRKRLLQEGLCQWLAAQFQLWM